jgi:predicted ATP-grasp superfamily ATP-dependent carboligase
MGMTPADQEFGGNFDTSVAALVLNFGAYPLHQSSLGIIRSLGRARIPVFAVQQNPFIPSGASRYLTGKFLWRTDARDSGRFLEGMARIGKILDRPTILVPADDLSAILIAEHADELPSQFIFARPSATLPRTLANKRCLYELCHRLGIACPHTDFVYSRDELLDLATHIQFPVVVKVTEAWIRPKNIKSTVIVSGRRELIDYYDHFWRQAPTTTLMIQKMIPTDSSEDWFVHGYCDGRSNPVAVFTGVKLRSYPAFAGQTALGRSVRNDALREQAIKLFSAIGYSGIMDLDYRFDRRDGSYNLLDFNPRIGAQFRLFETQDGIDVVRALHLDLTGRGVKVGPQIDGRSFVLEIQDLLARLSYYRSGDRSVKDRSALPRGGTERAWWASDDPLPFFFMCLWMSCRAVSRVLRLNWSRTSEEGEPRLLSR